MNRGDYEDFLFHEAALLDEWRLPEWLALFTEDAIYEVPTAGAANDANSATSLFYIADDHMRLRHRVNRLMKREAHSEFPRSKTMRMIGNVRILNTDGITTEIASAFITYRSKNSATDTFFGHHRYVIKSSGGGPKIAVKRSFLDADNLRPQGRVSIIL
jgi:p-cumate 2,3-dioxygenase beta subunit